MQRVHRAAVAERSGVFCQMAHDVRTILEYGTRSTATPQRVWIPIAYLSLSVLVWWGTPRLTPTGFPNALDRSMLILLAPTVFVIARWTSLPGWVFTLFGAVEVGLFLFANFQDNNFRGNTEAKDIIVPWSLMVAGAAVGARVIAGVGRCLGFGGSGV